MNTMKKKKMIIEYDREVEIPAGKSEPFTDKILKQISEQMYNEMNMKLDDVHTLTGPNGEVISWMLKNDKVIHVNKPVETMQ